MDFTTTKIVGIPELCGDHVVAIVSNNGAIFARIPLGLVDETQWARGVVHTISYAPPPGTGLHPDERRVQRVMDQVTELYHQHAKVSFPVDDTKVYTAYAHADSEMLDRHQAEIILSALSDLGLPRALESWYDATNCQTGDYPSDGAGVS